VFFIGFEKLATLLATSKYHARAIFLAKSDFIGNTMLLNKRHLMTRHDTWRDKKRSL
jgi:hypothetical protein